MISYWGKINDHALNINELRSCIYNATRSYYNHNTITNNSLYFKWIHCIKSILCNCGLSGIWESHIFPNQKWLSLTTKRKLKDIYLGEWYQNVDSNKNYRLFKTSCKKFEPYLLKLFLNQFKYIISYRTRNHRLPIEIGRWKKIKYNRRICTLCKQGIGNEYHYLLACKELKSIRKQYIKPFYSQRPKTFKYEKLMNNSNIKVLSSLAKFINIIYDANKENRS